MELELQRRELRFREPVPTAYGTLERRELLVVRLRGADGKTGIGEAAPLEPYDGASLEAARAQIESCRDLLASSDGAEPAELLAACRERCPLPQALAAIDLALWDLRGRRAARPVCELLAPHPAREILVNALIPAMDPRTAAAHAAAACEAGFSCLKVKVGRDDDAGRLAAVRAAVDRSVTLRLDANGAWTVDGAVRALTALVPFGLELCEEPVRGVEDLRALRAALHGRVRIAMDETAADPGAIASGAADAVCLKVSASGGITGLLEAAHTARAAGTDVYLASTFDGPVGIAAALHAAAALSPLPPCGLATLGLFSDASDPFAPRQGTMAVPVAPGLGVAG
jgi:o-succinylbenzoate synthase